MVDFRVVPTFFPDEGLVPLLYVTFGVALREVPAFLPEVVFVVLLPVAEVAGRRELLMLVPLVVRSRDDSDKDLLPWLVALLTVVPELCPECDLE